MNDINNVTLSGNLVRDPETKGDGKVARFTIASNRSFRRNGEDEYTEEVAYVNCSAFNGTARMIVNKLRKGDKLTVAGRLELNRWETTEGEKREQLRLIVNSVVAEGLFRKAEQPPSPAEAAATDDAPAPEAEAVGVAVESSDDIPF